MKDNRFYKFPRGFKKKLAKHYGLDKPKCVLCWSTNRVAIDHYRDLDHKNYPYGKVNWDDFSKFTLLCGSCHGKVEKMRECWWGSTRESRPPMLNLLDDIVMKSNIQT